MSSADRQAQFEHLHACGVHAEYADLESMSLRDDENLLLVHRKCRVLILTLLSYYMLFHQRKS